jgi:lipopolysaccharide transport system permease protein
LSQPETEGRFARLRRRTGRAAKTAGKETLENLPDLLMGEGFGDTTPTYDEEAQEGERRRPRRRRRVRTKSSFTQGVSVIQPRQPGVLARVREYWRFRRMTLYFGFTFLEKFYRRTVLGWVWIPLRPVISVGTRVLVFGGLLAAPSGGVPYTIFFLVSFASWQLFGYTAFWGTRSIELSRGILNKMYIPRLTCLTGAVVISLVNFALYIAIAAIVVLVYLFFDGTTYLDPGPGLVLTFAGIALALLLAQSIALWTSILNARARDVRFAMQFVLGFWFFLTPIIYPLSQVPAAFQTVASLNPMTAPIEMIRIGLFGTGELPIVALCSTLAMILIVGGGGLRFFMRSERLALDSL